MTMRRRTVRCFTLIRRFTILKLTTAISLLFSGEEAYGKYMDLYTNHTMYCNFKNIGRRPGYLQYLDILIPVDSEPLHQELPKETRFSKDYETYADRVTIPFPLMQ